MYFREIICIRRIGIRPSDLIFLCYVRSRCTEAVRKRLHRRIAHPDDPSALGSDRLNGQMAMLNVCIAIALNLFSLGRTSSFSDMQTDEPGLFWNSQPSKRIAASLAMRGRKSKKRGAISPARQSLVIIRRPFLRGDKFPHVRSHQSILRRCPQQMPQETVSDHGKMLPPIIEKARIHDFLQGDCQQIAFLRQQIQSNQF